MRAPWPLSPIRFFGGYATSSWHQPAERCSIDDASDVPAVSERRSGATGSRLRGSLGPFSPNGAPAIQAFIRARGCAPPTVTMHPHTLGMLTRMFVRRKAEKVLSRVLKVAQRREQGLGQGLEDARRKDARRAVKMVTAAEHDCTTIVMI
jgi:hypothetical protein